MTATSLHREVVCRPPSFLSTLRAHHIQSLICSSTTQCICHPPKMSSTKDRRTELRIMTDGVCTLLQRTLGVQIEMPWIESGVATTWRTCYQLRTRFGELQRQTCGYWSQLSLHIPAILPPWTWLHKPMSVQSIQSSDVSTVHNAFVFMFHSQPRHSQVVSILSASTKSLLFKNCQLFGWRP